MSFRNSSRSASSSCASSSSMAAHTGTTSAPSATARSRTASSNGLFSKPSSATLAMYISGFRVSRNRSRTSAFSSSSRPRLRADLPSLSPAASFCSTGFFANASLSFALAARSARFSALSTDSRSASASSDLMVSMSAIGSTLPATWITSPSKQRTTWAIASTSRMCARNLLPRPSPFDAPATRPAMSTNSTAVGTTFCGLTIAASAFSRGSGTGTTPTFGSIVQNGKLAAAMPALVSALNRVDLPTLGSPTMPHLMPMDLIPGIGNREWGIGKAGVGMLLRLPIPHSLFPRRVQLLHRLVELPIHRQRQHVQGARDAVQDGGFVRGGRPAQHPRRDLILVAGVADAHAQAMELAVAEVAHDVAQAVLPTVAAVELQAHGTGRQVQVVMRDQTLFGFDLVIAQRRNHGDAALVHEGGGLEQPDRFAAKAHAAALAMQLAVEGEPLALAAGKGVHQPEPGIVPGSEVFGAGIAQPDDEFQSSHCAASHAWPRAGRARGRTTYFLSAAGWRRTSHPAWQPRPWSLRPRLRQRPPRHPRRFP